MTGVTQSKEIEVAVVGMCDAVQELGCSSPVFHEMFDHGHSCVVPCGQDHQVDLNLVSILEGDRLLSQNNITTRSQNQKQEVR